ncbi:MAG: hypothetical protein GEU98_20580 [Pseudonocardiaceae bacterium]|nr:hypothetical protein [Pseudonocardiaceae bacterium]
MSSADGDGGVDGFFLDPYGMTEQTAKLNIVVDNFAQLPSNKPSPPDAGPSTNEVGVALSNLMTAAASISEQLADIAGKVDVSKDMYHETDNNSASVYRRPGM